MAAGSRCGNVGEAEKLYRLVEERFLANDVAGALRAAREAQMLSRTLPGLSSALAAYEVHAAAAVSRANGRNWYAVLGVGGRSLTSGGGGVITHDAIKQRYRRLCLVLHPDKNRSAAADGAFKLLQQAWTTLSARYPPAPAAATAKPRADPTPFARSRTGAEQPRPARTAGPQASASAAKPNHSRPPSAASAYDPKSEKRRANPTPARGDSFRSVYCHYCHLESQTADDEEDGVKCTRCHEQLRPPRQSGPPPPAGKEYTVDSPPLPRGRRGGNRFRCPARCPRCRTQYAATVSVGMWHLECMACHKYAMVHVRSPYNAETW